MGRSNTGIESRPTGKKKKVAVTCVILSNGIYVDQIINAIENFVGGASRIPAGENQRMMEGRQRRNQHRNRNFTFISGINDLLNIIATALEKLLQGNN